ncbi:MAG: class I SAM-dependent methyltransferase [Chitinophagaceae bacterium]
MNSTDLFNETLANTIGDVDQVNKKFYGRYNYPWPPLMLPGYPEHIAGLFLSQDIGSWQHNRMPRNPKIWVAGCGTNQALLTALKFPEAEVTGTDISVQSLSACKKNAEQIGVKNLQLEERSLNEANYEEQFDYVICTGVIHHNAKPWITLQHLRNALKKDGILELMVYNYYQRLFTTACQKAIRNFYDATSGINLEIELALAKKLIEGFPYDSNSLMGDFLNLHALMHEAEMTDSLIQPVEYSYTIESLNEMAEGCGLELLLHCQNQFDVKNDAYTWNMNFGNAHLREKYYALPDLKRWQITNLLLCNQSPMLWFYLQRKDAGTVRQTEQQVVKEFLETRFSKSSFPVKNYVLDQNGSYQLQEKPLQYPALSQLTDPGLKKIYELVNPSVRMRDIFYQLKMKPDFNEVNKARLKLTTSGYPYILASN